MITKYAKLDFVILISREHSPSHNSTQHHTRRSEAQVAKYCLEFYILPLFTMKTKKHQGGTEGISYI